MQETMINKQVKTKQQIQLVDGNFTVSEASDVVLTLLNEKINFHKLQRLTLCEGFSGANTKYPDQRITELEKEKSIAKEFFAQARAEGLTLNIDGILKISVNKK